MKRVLSDALSAAKVERLHGEYRAVRKPRKRQTFDSDGFALPSGRRGRGLAQALAKARWS